MSEQKQELARAVESIREIILGFCRARPLQQFCASELRHYVAERSFIAPASPDRVLRALRQAGELNYKVVNRRKSIYELIPVVVRSSEEGSRRG